MGIIGNGIQCLNVDLSNDVVYSKSNIIINNIG